MKDAADGLTRKRGRPRSTDPPSAVTAWLRASEHDALCALSLAKSRSISSLVRHAVVVFLTDESSNPRRR